MSEKLNQSYSTDVTPPIIEQEKEMMKQEIKGITIAETYKLKKSINIDNLTSQGNLREGTKGIAVQALQAFLIKKGCLEGKADSKFGPKTKTALQKYQKDIIGYKNPDGVLTVSKNKQGKYYKTLEKIIDSEGFFPSHISDRSATKEEVLAVNEKANESMEANKNMLEKSQEFYEALEAREDGGYRNDILSDIGSVWGILREVFGENKASEYFKKMKSYKEVLNKEGMSERFNAGYDYLVGESSTRDKSLMFYGFRDILLGVFAGIPSFDVRMNFMKTLNNSGVNMERAYIFSEWATSPKGMQNSLSFEDYEKTKGKDIKLGKNLDKNLNALRGTITAYITSNYNVDEQEITNQLIEKLRKTDKNLDNLIITYIDSRFIPDVEMLLAGGFNIFEHFFDEKYNDLKFMIDGLKGGEVLLKTKNKAKKTMSSSKEFKDVFLLKNNDKFYLHIGSEYMQFYKKRPTKEEIEYAIIEYNNLSVTTYGEGSGKTWTRRNLNPGDTKSYMSKQEKLSLGEDILKIFLKQKDESIGSTKKALEKGMVPVDERLQYYTKINNKNSKFLKSAIKILKSTNGITPEVKQNFGIITFYNSVDDFLNAYILPDNVETEIKKLLNISNITPEQYVKNLISLSNYKIIQDAFDAIKGLSGGLPKYRLDNLNEKIVDIPKGSRIDAKKHKYGARILTRREFEMPYIKLQAEYKERFDTKTSIQDFEQEFTGTFKDVYSFEQPSTYKEYLKALSQTGPNIADEIDGKYWSTMNLWERGLIEAGVLDVTGNDLLEAIIKKGKALPIESLYEDPEIFINTARQAGYDYDSITTFLDLHNKRGDKSIIHTTIDRSFSYTTKTGENITQNITYDVYMRPECQNIYVLPNSESIQLVKTRLKSNNAVSILKTPSIPIGLFNILGGNGAININTPWSNTTPQGGGAIGTAAGTNNAVLF